MQRIAVNPDGAKWFALLCAWIGAEKLDGKVEASIIFPFRLLMLLVWDVE